jgi:hypothetical protein
MTLYEITTQADELITVCESLKDVADTLGVTVSAYHKAPPAVNMYGEAVKTIKGFNVLKFREEKGE